MGGRGPARYGRRRWPVAVRWTSRRGGDRSARRMPGHAARAAVRMLGVWIGLSLRIAVVAKRRGCELRTHRYCRPVPRRSPAPAPSGDPEAARRGWRSGATRHPHPRATAIWFHRQRSPDDRLPGRTPRLRTGSTITQWSRSSPFERVFRIETFVRNWGATKTRSVHSGDGGWSIGDDRRPGAPDRGRQPAVCPVGWDGIGAAGCASTKSTSDGCVHRRWRRAATGRPAAGAGTVAATPGARTGHRSVAPPALAGRGAIERTGERARSPFGHDGRAGQLTAPDRSAASTAARSVRMRSSRPSPGTERVSVVTPASA